MAAFVYYITLPVLYFISLLPFRLLYIVSDFLYIFLYRILLYRTKVVNENLRKSFPEKSEEEIRSIQNRFYHFLFDLILESFKTLTISPKSLLERVKMDDGGIFKKFYEMNQSIIIAMGHLGNWELGGARFSQEKYHQLYVIYHPLKNEYFNDLTVKMRTRLGNGLYSMNETLRGMLKNKDKITATAFIADQTPSPKGAYWTTFLNQSTPVFTGLAKIAKKLDYPIIYVSVKRQSRGFYILQSELLIEHPALLNEDEISEMYTKRLEKDIMECPEIWLWSHRRWKHKKPNE